MVKLMIYLSIRYLCIVQEYTEYTEYIIYYIQNYIILKVYIYNQEKARART